jgi:hypothetical protein
MLWVVQFAMLAAVIWPEIGDGLRLGAYAGFLLVEFGEFYG